MRMIFLVFPEIHCGGKSAGSFFCYFSKGFLPRNPRTCAQTAVTADFVRRVERCGSAARAVLPKMRLQTWLMPVLVNRRVQGALEGWPRSAALEAGFIPWDVVALLAAVRPQLFTGWDFLEVAFPRCSQEPCNGTMVTRPSEATGSHSNIVSVPKFITNETLILENMLELLCSVPSVEPLPSLEWGFGREVFANSLLVICMLPIFCWKKKGQNLVDLAPRFCTVLGTLSDSSASRTSLGSMFDSDEYRPTHSCCFYSRMYILG